MEEKDDAYTKDIQVPLKLWDLDSIRNSLLKILKKEKYDFVIVLLPESNTHGHHKCASLLALEVIEKLEVKDRPIVLGAPDAPSLDPKSYIPVDGFPITKVEENAPIFEFNRLRSFGKNNRLNYNVIARLFYSLVVLNLQMG